MGQISDFLTSVSVYFRQNVLKFDLKKSRICPFEANLTNFEAEPNLADICRLGATYRGGSDRYSFNIKSEYPLLPHTLHDTTDLLPPAWLDLLAFTWYDIICCTWYVIRGTSCVVCSRTYVVRIMSTTHGVHGRLSGSEGRRDFVQVRLKDHHWCWNQNM